MNPSRRNLLISAGGAGLALLGVGAAFAATRTPHRAFAPWQVSPADDVRLERLPPRDPRAKPAQPSALADHAGRQR